jgi:protein-S-isoprenylcysteine O-methyltransferase Ste14
MIAKLLLQNTIFVVALGTLLFASAGTLHWPAAWVFLVISAILGPACGLWLAKTDPALLAERMRPTFQADQPAADKKFMLTFAAVALIWLVAIGLDRRAQASDVPIPLQALGLAMYLLSNAFIMWVFRENSFAAPVVKVQAARHHRVISSGPYAFVRHPMYSGIMLFFVGAPLLLGSWWAWRSRRCSPSCSPFAPASRSARWSKDCLIMLTTPRACAIVWCPDFGERSRMVDRNAR